jgi:cytochrome c
MRMKIGFVAAMAVALLAGCGGPAEETPAEAPAAATPAVPVPALADLPAPYNEANLEEGAIQYAKCRNCHSLVAAEGNKVGPNLHGVFDRHPGTAPKFKYSPALKAYAEERWTPEHIDHWLQKPKDFLPGTAMFFNGIDDPIARRDVIGYLLIESRK